VVASLGSAALLVGLEDLVRWGGDIVEVVVQDEFTHDVVVRADGGFLVFDTT